MARLLTELDDPSSLAAVVSADIAVEKDVLHYLTALIDAHTDPGTWPLSHGAIAQTLARLEADTQRCDVRLAARLADQEAGTMSVVPSPAEETDPVLRLWAARLKDAEHTVKIRNDLHTATEEHVQRIIQIRRDAQ